MTAFTPPLSQLAAAVPSADMTVRGFAARLPKMEVLSRALHRSTSNQHRLPSDRRTEEPYRRSRGLRSEHPWSLAHYHVLMGIRTCGSLAREADEQLERGHGKHA